MVYHVTKVDWESKCALLKSIRERVFVYELNLPREVEFDALDPAAQHVIILDEYENAVGTGRLCPNGLISRVALLQSHRNRQAYCAILNFLVVLAKEHGLQKISINCILDEVPTFMSSGFAKTGCVFMEAGIARQPLSCPVNNFNSKPFTMLH